MNKRRLSKLLMLFFAFTLFAAACGDSGDSSTDSGDDSTETTAAPADDGDTTETTAAEEPTETTMSDEDMAGMEGGGEIILAAEQWPECLNPATSCANASWLSFSVLTHVLPRAMELNLENAFVPSPVLTEAPTADNGGAVLNDDDTFTLTFNINPDAVWSDGTPITSTDFKFTWEATLNTTGTLSTIGMDKITAVDDSDPAVAVIEFEEPYAPWPDLFGGTTGYLYPAHAFASTDIAEDWNDEITVSGGPWILESWSQDQAILVPNENYWDADRIPLVDRVVIVPREDTDTEVVALQTGEVFGIYPQPFPGATERLTDDSIEFVLGGGTFMEGLWINQDSPDENPGVAAMNDPLVRQALIYSLDRQSIADVAIGDGGTATVLQCTGWNPFFGDWCDDTDYAQYDQDFDKAAELLTEAGYTRDGDSFWQKDGEDLVIGWNTVAGNKRREDVQALVVEMTKPGGIGWAIENYDAGELFENRLPVLNFGPIALFANSTSPDPSVAGLYDIEGIPSPDDPTGQNYTAYRNQTASDLGFEIDRTVDPAARLELVRELGDILAVDVPWIPLYLLPNLLVWRTDLIEGPIADAAFSAYGGFTNMYDWSLVG